MTFTRTNSGLTNLALFNRCDSIVFLEGGPSISSEDLSNGKYNSNTCDIRFWQSLFTKFRPNNNYHFRSLGSKTAVTAIANKIASGEISNTIAAMDRDFQNLSGALITNQNIIYTHGYSWENDCWSASTIFETYISIVGACRIAAREVLNGILELLEAFKRSITKLVTLDAILIQQDQSFFDRECYEKYIYIDRSKKPSPNISQLRNTLKHKRQALARPIRRRVDLRLNPLEDCFGHLYESFSFRVLSYFLHNTDNIAKPAKDYVQAVLVDRFIQSLPTNNREVFEHYNREFARITN